MDSDGRYHLVSNAVFAPGVDLLTGSAQGPFVDTGLRIPLQPFVSYDTEDPRGRDQVQQFTQVYLQPTTILELAQVAGFTARDQDEIDTAYNEGYEAGRAAVLQMKEIVSEQNDRGLADRVDRLLRAIESAADGDVVPAAEPAPVVVDGVEEDARVPGQGRRTRSSV